MVWSLALS